MITIFSSTRKWKLFWKILSFEIFISLGKVLKLNYFCQKKISFISFFKMRKILNKISKIYKIYKISKNTSVFAKNLPRLLFLSWFELFEHSICRLNIVTFQMKKENKFVFSKKNFESLTSSFWQKKTWNIDVRWAQLDTDQTR